MFTTLFLSIHFLYFKLNLQTKLKLTKSSEIKYEQIECYEIKECCEIIYEQKQCHEIIYEQNECLEIRQRNNLKQIKWNLD